MVILSVTIPVYFSVTVLTSYKTVVKILQEVDYTDYINKNELIKEALEKSGSSPQEMNEKIKSAPVAEVIQKHAPTLNDALLNIPTDETFDISAVQDAVNENIKEITDIAEAYTEKELSQATLNERINETVEKKRRGYYRNSSESSKSKILFEGC